MASPRGKLTVGLNGSDVKGKAEKQTWNENI